MITSRNTDSKILDVVLSTYAYDFFFGGGDVFNYSFPCVDYVVFRTGN